MSEAHNQLPVRKEMPRQSLIVGDRYENKLPLFVQDDDEIEDP